MARSSRNGLGPGQAGGGAAGSGKGCHDKWATSADGSQSGSSDLLPVLHESHAHPPNATGKSEVDRAWPWNP
eukprot:5662285-Pyramimonas_sp.AAC.2